MNRAWEVYEVTSEAMEDFLLKFFQCEARIGKLSNEMREPTSENPDHISFESTNLFKNLHNKLETSKQRVRGKIKCYLINRSNFFQCQIFFVSKEFLWKFCLCLLWEYDWKLNFIVRGQPLLTPLFKKRLKIYKISAVSS